MLSSCVDVPYLYKWLFLQLISFLKFTVWLKCFAHLHFFYCSYQKYTWYLSAVSMIVIRKIKPQQLINHQGESNFNNGVQKRSINECKFIPLQLCCFLCSYIVYLQHDKHLDYSWWMLAYDFIVLIVYLDFYDLTIVIWQCFSINN